MRPFRLKKTITQATMLTAFLPTAAVLAQQIQAPIGLNGKITIAAGTIAVMGHEVVPAGLTPMDPKSAPARGGYVYDAFNTVVRTGVTRECVKHGLWSPELATPDCEPWLFAKPAAPQAAVPATPAPAPAPAPAPVAKEEGFPEWMGPDEARQGIVPIWPQDNLEPEDNIGLPRMYFDGDEQAADQGPDDLISEPTLYGEAPESDFHSPELIGEPIMPHDGDDQAGKGDDLISAPRRYDDEPAAQGDGRWPADPFADPLASGATDAEEAAGIGSNDNWMPNLPEDSGVTALVPPQFTEGQWPADPYAAQQEPEEAAAVGSNDSWMPAPQEERAAAAPSTMMDYKEEGWPIDKFAEGYVEDQSVAVPDSDWMPPQAVADSGMDPMAGQYTEEGKEPEEAISNPVMHYDVAEDDQPPADNISQPTMSFRDSEEDARVGSQDLVSQPRTPPDEPAVEPAVEPYGKQFDERPFPEVAATQEPEGEPFNKAFPAPQAAATPAPDAAPAPAPAASSTDAELVAEEDDDDDAGDYQPDYSTTLAAKDAFSDLPAGSTPAAPAVAAAPTTPAKAPEPPAQEEHLMTVVLSADALFDFDRYMLKPSARKSLDDFVQAVKELKWGQIQVVGHTDRLGSTKYNQRLSERRAAAVRKQLIARGLDGRKIKAIGRGKSQPVTTDCVGDKRNPELIACLQPDRRVEIFVDEKREVKIIKPAKPK